MNHFIFQKWNSFKKYTTKNIIINFGPQHPAAHGVLRLILQMSNELIEKSDIHIGLLHRATESLVQTKHYEKSIPYFDRLDYVSMMSQEHVFCLTIERLLKITDKYIYSSYIRILFDELTRILNHFLAIACHALDIGSMSSIFWAFEERENIMEFYERICGARMHSAFHKPLNLFNNPQISTVFINDILLFIKNCFKTLNEMHNVLSYNKIWKQRLINVATLNIKDCQNYSLTGVLSRATGIKKDVRLSKNTYSNYNSIKLKSFVGLNGDTYDRFLIRMLEMGESLNICNNVCTKLNNLKYETNNIYNTLSLNVKNNNSSMEELINHFINWHSGLYIKKNVNSVYIESPKGEFGVILASNNSNKPFKCKIRSPSYFNLQALNKMIKGHFISDLSAIIGTIDIVFGEIDR